jgi:hypothetical protein
MAGADGPRQEVDSVADVEAIANVLISLHKKGEHASATFEHGKPTITLDRDDPPPRTLFARLRSSVVVKMLIATLAFLGSVWPLGEKAAKAAAAEVPQPQRVVEDALRKVLWTRSGPELRVIAEKVVEQTGDPKLEEGLHSSVLNWETLFPELASDILSATFTVNPIHTLSAPAERDPDSSQVSALVKLLRDHDDYLSTHAEAYWQSARAFNP